MEKSLKREFELLYLAFTQFRPIPDEQRTSLSPDLQEVARGIGTDVRSWLAMRYGVTKTGNLQSAMDKRWTELSRRQGRAYRIDKLRRALARLEMQVRGDPEQFDKDYEAAVRSLIDLS